MPCKVSPKYALIHFMNKLPEDKLKIKLIALDLDDTLLDKDAQISEENVKALQKCVEKGIYVVLCSGRAEDGILPFVRRLDIAGKECGRFLIAINGCSVFDLHKRVQIYCKSVPSDILLRANELSEEMDLLSEVYSPDTIYYRKETKWTRLDVDLCLLKGEEVEDYESFLKEKSFPKMLIPGEPERLQVLQEKLKSEFKDRAVVFTSKPYFLELLPPNCGKGEAIEYLAKTLGFGLDECMCFGDSMNDENMIVKCEHSVAMKNGLDYIKDKAKYVSEKTNNESGVADFINKFVL